MRITPLTRQSRINALTSAAEMIKGQLEAGADHEDMQMTKEEFEAYSKACGYASKAITKLANNLELPQRKESSDA